MRFEDPPRARHADAPPPDDGRRRPDDVALRAVVSRLSRPDRSGGHVVERAALMADGTDFAALLRWIESHGGVPEALPPAAGGRSTALFGDRRPQHPLRFVLPASAFA
jgi:hypothetical protein